MICLYFEGLEQLLLDFENVTAKIFFGFWRVRGGFYGGFCGGEGFTVEGSIEDAHSLLGLVFFYFYGVSMVGTFLFVVV